MSGDSLQGPRLAKRDDLPGILDLVNLVHRTLKGRRSRVENDFPHVYDPANVGNIVIVTQGQRVVSVVAVWPNDIQLGEVRLRVGGINCLATLPELRKQGLGRRVMEASHERMRELGCHVGLLGTRIPNWYRGLGWEKAGCWVTYTFDRGNIGLLPALPDGIAIREAGAESLPDVVRLRNADRLGAVRDVESFRPVLMRHPPQVFVAERGSGVAGYAFVRGRSAIEWAGPAPVVAGIVRGWFETHDDREASTSERGEDFKARLEDRLEVSGPCWGHPFMSLLKELRIPPSIGYAGMMFPLDPRGILDAYGLGEITVDGRNDQVILRRGAESFSANTRRLSRLLFGPEKVADFAEDVLPLPFCQWPLEHV